MGDWLTGFVFGFTAVTVGKMLKDKEKKTNVVEDNDLEIRKRMFLENNEREAYENWKKYGSR